MRNMQSRRAEPEALLQQSALVVQCQWEPNVNRRHLVHQSNSLLENTATAQSPYSSPISLIHKKTTTPMTIMMKKKVITTTFESISTGTSRIPARPFISLPSSWKSGKRPLWVSFLMRCSTPKPRSPRPLKMLPTTQTQPGGRVRVGGDGACLREHPKPRHLRASTPSPRGQQGSDRPCISNAVPF